MKLDLDDLFKNSMAGRI